MWCRIELLRMEKASIRLIPIDFFKDNIEIV